jgi:hypothetical protein
MSVTDEYEMASAAETEVARLPLQVDMPANGQIDPAHHAQDDAAFGVTCQ